MTSAVLLALAAAAASAGPVGITIPHRQVAERGHIFNLNASFSGRQGNGPGLQAGGSLMAAVGIDEARHLLLLRARGDYAEYDHVIGSSSSFGHLRHQYSLKGWLLTDLFVQSQQDRFQGLRFRNLAGAGPAFRVYETDAVSIRGGTTAMWEREGYNAGTERPDRPAGAVWRSSSYLAVSVGIAGNAAFTLSAYVQPRMSAFSDLRVLDEAALDVGINKWLTTRLSAVLRHDSRPAGGVRKTDIEMRHSLGVTL